MGVLSITNNPRWPCIAIATSQLPLERALVSEWKEEHNLSSYKAFGSASFVYQATIVHLLGEQEAALKPGARAVLKNFTHKDGQCEIPMDFSYDEMREVFY